MEKTEAQDLPVTKIAFRVAYAGEQFTGSQVQPGMRTVEGEFIAACVRLGLFTDWRQAGFCASGRTDRGVHATGQVFAFSTVYPDRAILAMNFQLPSDCWCTAYSLVPPGFHPRYDAKWRTYRYFFIEEGLDIRRMGEAGRVFEGTHNFSGYANVGDKNPERTIKAVSVKEDQGVTFLEITAESFLWHMVRCIATAMRDVGTGKCDPFTLRERLEGRYCTGLHPAPANGLVLRDVGYDFLFTKMPGNQRREDKILEWQGYHRVMGRICDAFLEESRAEYNEPWDF